MKAVRSGKHEQGYLLHFKLALLRLLCALQFVLLYLLSKLVINLEVNFVVDAVQRAMRCRRKGGLQYRTAKRVLMTQRRTTAGTTVHTLTDG